MISLGKPQVEVPFLIGQDKKDAEAALVAQGFEVELKEEESDEDKDTVTRTEPSQGTTVAEGTTIVVYFSDGREKVPDLVGKQQAEAENAVRNAGFEPRVIHSADTTEAGRHRDRPEPAGRRDAVRGLDGHDRRLQLRRAAGDPDAHADARRDVRRASIRRRRLDRRSRRRPRRQLARAGQRGRVVEVEQAVVRRAR